MTCPKGRPQKHIPGRGAIKDLVERLEAARLTCDEPAFGGFHVVPHSLVGCFFGLRLHAPHHAVHDEVAWREGTTGERHQQRSTTQDRKERVSALFLAIRSDAHDPVYPCNDKVIIDVIPGFL